MYMVEVIPGINELEWPEIQRKLEQVTGYVPWVQIDFADGTLVPNMTCMDLEKFREVSENVSLEAHLMVAHPEKYVKQLADVGFKRLIAHVEAVDPRLFLEEVQYESVEVGLAIDGPTEFDVFEPFLNEIDLALVMTIEAGPSGQPFLPETVEKIRILRRNLPDLAIEVDGGINDKTAPIVIEAGATRLVSTSYIFKNPRGVSAAISELQQR